MATLFKSCHNHSLVVLFYEFRRSLFTSLKDFNIIHPWPVILSYLKRTVCWYAFFCFQCTTRHICYFNCNRLSAAGACYYCKKVWSGVRVNFYLKLTQISQSKDVRRGSVRINFYLKLTRYQLLIMRGIFGIFITCYKSSRCSVFNNYRSCFGCYSCIFCFT